MDELWAGAWWHLGTTFFRQGSLPWRGEMTRLLHLRLRLERYSPSESQRRVLRRNADLRVVPVKAQLDERRRELFDRHKLRFTENIPSSLEDFLGPHPSSVPVPTIEFGIYSGDELVAASYLACGQESVASLYGFFAPEWSRRSLGVLTMLHEIQFARERGYRIYYPGYALVKPSSMDYKKRFHGLESFDWTDGWKPFGRVV